MNIPHLHSWDLSYREAVQLQHRLRSRISLDPLPLDSLRHVAGVDVSYRKHGEDFFAGIVLLSFPGLDVVEEASAVARVTFPYIPGLLSFRELPVLLQAFSRLNIRPDAVLVDGQGIAHPRRLGLAAHLGLWLDLPTVGCAKSRLCGDYDPPGKERGQRSTLRIEGEEVGKALRTRSGVKPMFISPGHRIDVPTAVELVLACGGRYRLPEPTRLAHLLTNRLRRGWEEGRGGAQEEG